MSEWSYITGVITVRPLGNTQAQKEYVLKTVLDHLPEVSGSEDAMHVYITQKAGYNNISSCNEFMRNIPGGVKTQDEYLLTVDANLRDGNFDETYKMFCKWLFRLSKRIIIYNVFVMISDYWKETIINTNKLYDYYEYELNWNDYLYWEQSKNNGIPRKLRKYYENRNSQTNIKKSKYKRYLERKNKIKENR